MKRFLKYALMLMLCVSMSIPGSLVEAMTVVASAESSDEMRLIDKQSFVIPHSNAAIYTCTVDYTEGDEVSVKLGEHELLSLSGDVLRLCDAKVYGSYTDGKYSFTLSVAPILKMVYTEIILPDGGVLRRGRADIDMTADSITAYCNNDGVLLDCNLSLEGVSENYYELRTVEPMNFGFNKNVYNIITSFDDASTTRLFAWTANAYFVLERPMAVRYRVAGTSEWSVADATKVTENTEVEKEDYYKASITGLTPDTEYEYSIGIKDSTDEESSWSTIYLFKTAASEVGDFTFLAISDNQGVTWGGSTADTKGYKYTLSAVNEAFEEHPDAAFILNLGDMTERGYRTTEWNWYFKCLSSYAMSVPHFAVMGNHECEIADSNNYFSLHFNHPDNGANAIDTDMITDVSADKSKVLLESYEETVYSYDYGNAHFIVLFTGTLSDDDEMIVKAQREWLINDLEANKDAKWTIVMQHGVTYHRYGGSYDSRWLNDIFESYGVDLVLQGHSHLVTRTHPMKNGQIVSNSLGDVIPEGIGTVYTTIGGTTYIHDRIGDPNVAACLNIVTPAADQAAYTAVSLKSNKLTVTIKQINGYILDEFVIWDGTPDPIPEVDDDQVAKNPPNIGAIVLIAACALGVIGTAIVTAIIVTKKKSSPEKESE